MDEWKKKLASGECLLGTHVSCCDMTNVEIMGNCGFDYIWIDMEHSPITKEVVQGHLTAARACTKRPATFIRVAWNDPVIVKPLLDMGPTGIVFPMINNKQDAERAVAACRYPPAGIRGFSPRAVVRYGLDDIQDYIHNRSKNIWVMCQIETMEAYKNLDDILTCTDVDGYIIGPMDLSGQFGKLGKILDPEVDGAITEIAQKVRAAGKPVGISVGGYDYDFVKHWLEKGINMISCGGDVAFMRNGSLQVLDRLNRAYEEVRNEKG